MSGTLLRKTYLRWRLLQGTTTHSKNARVYDWDVIRMGDEEEEWLRVLASSGTMERYLERKHRGKWMAVEGLRWVKERAEKLPTSMSWHPCYPFPATRPCAKTGQRRAWSEQMREREGRRKRDKEKDKAKMRRGSVKPEPLRSLSTFFSVWSNFSARF